MIDDLNDKIEEYKTAIEVGLFLKQLRSDKEINLVKVSKVIGISANFLSEIERGIKSPSDLLIREIANFYQIDEDIIFDKMNRVPLRARNILERNKDLQKALSNIEKSDNADEIIGELISNINNICLKK